ncbi:MAG: M16 family metallopeptidase [Actinomycetota bacterium]
MTAELVSTKPTPSAPRAFRFPAFERARLDNGLTVITCDVPGRPLVSMRLVLEAGAFNEPADIAGVATLSARAMTEGSKRFPGIAFAEAAESIGADVSADPSWETVTVGAGVSVSRFAEALELIAEAALHPEFPDAEIERLKAERLNQIRQADMQPFQRAARAFYEAAYAQDSPFHRRVGGSAESVAALTRAHIAGYHQTFVTPGSATLVIAGDLSGLPVLKLAEQYFGAWRGEEPSRAAPRATTAIRETTVTIVDRPGSVQTNFIVGHGGIERGHADERALDVFDTIFGGSFSSRLNQKLREEKGYTYGARSAMVAGRIAGPYFCFAPVETSVTAPAIADTLETLRGTLDSGVTQDEVDFARNYMAGIFALRFETPEAIASGIVELVEFGLSDDYFDTYGPELQRLTVSDIDAAARAHLHPDALAIAMVGDAEKIAEPLRSVGVLSVIEEGSKA